MKRPSLTAQVYVALDALYERNAFSVPKDSTKRVMHVLMREHPEFQIAHLRGVLKEPVRFWRETVLRSCSEPVVIECTTGLLSRADGEERCTDASLLTALQHEVAKCSEAGTPALVSSAALQRVLNLAADALEGNRILRDKMTELVDDRAYFETEARRLQDALILAGLRIDFVTNWMENTYEGAPGDVANGRGYAEAARRDAAPKQRIKGASYSMAYPGPAGSREGGTVALARCWRRPNRRMRDEVTVVSDERAFYKTEALRLSRELRTAAIRFTRISSWALHSDALANQLRRETVEAFARGAREGANLREPPQPRGGA